MNAKALADGVKRSKRGTTMERISRKYSACSSLTYKVEKYKACSLLCHNVLLKVGCVEIEPGGKG